MRHSRREFLQAIGATAALGSSPRIARAAWLQTKTNFANKTLPGGAYVIGTINDGGNVLIVPTDEGPLMVDAKFAHTATELAADVQSLLGRNPALLINTHHHADHSGGNWVFSDAARIAAHRNFNPRIPANLPRYAQGAQEHASELAESNADPEKIKSANETAQRVKAMKAEQFQASQELADGVTIIDQGGVTAQCYHFGNGHTDNDIVVFLPRHNIMHMGDLLFHNVHPFIDRSAKANTAGWQHSLREAMKLGDDKTIIIPGHGEVTDKTALPKQIAYFDRMREIVSQAIKDGKTRDEVTAMNPEEFKHYGLERIRPLTLGGIYDELQEANR